jgi:hypothetical protein
MTFITESEKSTLKFIWKHKRPWIAKPILNTFSVTGKINVFLVERGWHRGDFLIFTVSDLALFEESIEIFSSCISTCLCVLMYVNKNNLG